MSLLEMFNISVFEMTMHKVLGFNVICDTIVILESSSLVKSCIGVFVNKWAIPGLFFLCFFFSTVNIKYVY